MKRLILVNTLYQLIVAIQLRNTYFWNDNVYLIVSENTKNAEQITEKLRSLNLFSQVVYIKNKGIIENRTSFDKIKDFIDLSFKDTNRYSFYLEQFNDKYFDEFLCYNFWTDSYGLYSSLCKYNPNIVFSFFEEGLLSYHFNPLDTGRRRFIRNIRGILGKKNVIDAFGNFYCFYPELYHGGLKTKKLENLNPNEKTAEQIRIIFNLQNQIIKYREKYIFFSSIYDLDGDEAIGEFELLLSLADLVGRENLLVKVHPRDTRTIYAENGLKVDENSSAPWEAIQLCGDFRKNVFLTTASSSVLSGCLMLPYSIPTFFLYKLCDIEKNGIASKAASEIERTLSNEKMKDVFSNIKIINKLEELL